LTAEDETPAAAEVAADGLTFAPLPPDGTRMIPRVRPNAIKMVRGAAMRITRFFLP